MNNFAVIQDGACFAVLGEDQINTWPALYPQGEELYDCPMSLYAFGLTVAELEAAGATIFQTREQAEARVLLLAARALVADNTLRNRSGAAPYMTAAERRDLYDASERAFRVIDGGPGPLLPLPLRLAIYAEMIGV